MSKVALVTGGTRGIGRAISERLAKDGYKVAANYAGNDEAAARCADELGIKVYKWDVGDYDACAAGISAVTAELGPVDILVNNAGITRDASFRKTTLDDWNSVMRTNLDSVFHMSKAVIDDMLGAGWGRIINISSVNGQRGAFGQANYAASKAGMHGFTKSLAIEFAKKGITVNTVSPGYLRTPMVTKMPPEVLEQRILPEIPLGRLGEPDEVAELVSFLASERATFITGANLSINGGQHMF